MKQITVPVMISGHQEARTETVYVRRDARAAMKENPWNRRKFQHTRLDEKFYTMMRTAFRGGNTHCNGDMTGQILDDVASYDLKSLYGFEDYMASEEYIEMIVDAVDKGATKEKFEAAIEKMLKKNERRPDDRKLDIDEIFEAALKESYKPVKKRRSRKKT